jgi:hypothetical protein
MLNLTLLEPFKLIIFLIIIGILKNKWVFLQSNLQENPSLPRPWIVTPMPMTIIIFGKIITIDFLIPDIRIEGIIGLATKSGNHL